MEEKRLILQDTASAISQSTGANILVNQGNGIQIQQNHGPISINVDHPELVESLFSMFNFKTANHPVTHAVEWASLSQERYCLFVLENEEYNNGVFSIAKDRALQKYTPENIRDSYRILDLERIKELKQMPCIFAKRNMYYGRTEANHLALAGRIRDIVPQGESITIYFDGFQAFSQQLLNQNVKFLHIASASMRNELDEEHWSIKQFNLIEAFTAMDVEIR